MRLPQTRLVSVVVPTKDRPTLLRQALASIRALERPGLRIEILVGDNGSDPRTARVAHQFGAVHLPTDRPGAGAARNVALRAAKGEFIAFLDDDDVWTSEHLADHVALLIARPRLGAVFGQILSTTPRGRAVWGPWPRDLPTGDDLLAAMLSGYFPQIGATVVRRRVLDAVGYFDESLIGGQDWDWQLRIARQFEIGFIRRPCVHFRQRPIGRSGELQSQRMPYTRRIFFRHALPLWRIWRSPMHFARAYFGAMSQYFYYFLESGIQYAREGDVSGAVKALARASTIFPTRAARTFLTHNPLRTQLAEAIRDLRPQRAGARGD